MANLYYNGMILDEKPSGLGIYSENTLRYIYDKINIDKIICQNRKYIHKFISNVDNNKISQIEINNSKFKSFYRNYTFKKSIMKIIKSSDDIVYSPTQHGINSNRFKQIITIHDLLPLYYPKGRWHQFLYYKHILPKYINKIDMIITVSESTKKDIIQYYGVESNKIKVIYNGCNKPKNIDKNKSVEYVFNKYKISDYLLMVGINYRYKNLHNVIMAYSEIKNKINKKLVIVGNDKVKYASELKHLIRKLNIEKEVLFLGYIDEKDKSYIYQAANVFIYPSLYEGFGIPPLEAMANGIPVICSNTSSLPEVVGDAAIMFDPQNITEIQEKILKTAGEDYTLRNELIRKGYLNIDKFCWQNTANEIVKIIKEVECNRKN